MAATWAARRGIHAKIIDKRGTKIVNGQADGLQYRSLEIFDSFGFADRSARSQITCWRYVSRSRLRLVEFRRSDRTPDTIPGISRFQQVVLHLGRIERFFWTLSKNTPISRSKGAF